MDINYIIAAPTVGRVRSSRSIETVKPLADALNIEIDSDWYVIRLFIQDKKSF